MAFRRQNYAIDADNQEHIDAYLALRAVNKRTTAKQLAMYIETLQHTICVGEQNKATFWAVPRGNFPEGLPDAIKKALCPADVTRDCSLPASDYFFIDMMINREQLGMGVGTCSKVLNKLTDGRIDAATGGGGGIDGELDGPRESAPGMLALRGTAPGMLALAANTAPSSGAAPSGGAATGVAGGRSLKRELSGATGEEPPSPESAAVKKHATHEWRSTCVGTALTRQ